MIRGRVQGVGFRHFIRREARHLGLSGWVCNLEDGTVELTAEGPAAALERLRAIAGSGPGSAKVTQVSEEWSEGPPQFQTFEITR
jgi:acylphosphatase